ncbi:hypothetical protein [Acinetobacter sp. ANC 4173]|uniref:hypothetical protein n=1 Tax=Acinetobacter sp. ANC 4173 TaxID=2529837 RepID=UPI00103AE197|nr:hypothetical protein [Acinetobacter sp. ANC 4173]TCB81110.1 hypothetical protein E0H94_05820 [Acinetobacter sp. ANC 4173]
MAQQTITIKHGAMMSSHNLISATVLASGLLLGFSSVNAFAEPAVQAGETLESLSQAKVSTTINGQPGSIQDLIQSGQVRLLNTENNPTASNMSATPNNTIEDASAVVPNQVIPPAPQLSSSASQPINSPDTDVTNNHLPESEQNLEAQPLQNPSEQMPAEAPSEVAQ